MGEYNACSGREFLCYPAFYLSSEGYSIGEGLGRDGKEISVLVGPYVRSISMGAVRERRLGD